MDWFPWPFAFYQPMKDGRPTDKLTPENPVLLAYFMNRNRAFRSTSDPSPRSSVIILQEPAKVVGVFQLKC